MDKWPTPIRHINGVYTFVHGTDHQPTVYFTDTVAYLSHPVSGFINTTPCPLQHYEGTIQVPWFEATLLRNQPYICTHRMYEEVNLVESEV